tara:strand:- start:759 stop:1004 length:246 start_codon:yes stop_codon:yes gene_type:complete
MTKLTSEVARESATIIKDPNGTDRNLIAGLAPSQEGGMLVMRLKGCKTDTTISLADLWALKNAAPIGICHQCVEIIKEVAK